MYQRKSNLFILN